MRVVILSPGNGGLLFENTVDDEAVGEELKQHVGDTVKAEGLVKVMGDGKGHAPGAPLPGARGGAGHDELERLGRETR
jgi:hypothetical protein